MGRLLRRDDDSGSPSPASYSSTVWRLPDRGCGSSSGPGRSCRRMRSRSCRERRDGRWPLGSRRPRGPSWCTPLRRSGPGRTAVGDWGIAASTADLGQGQLLEVLVEVRVGCRLHSVALVAVEVLVEVRGDDLALAVLAGVCLGEPQRLDDLADLAFLAAAGERALRQQPRANELLGDRGAAAGAAARACRSWPRRSPRDRSPGSTRSPCPRSRSSRRAAQRGSSLNATSSRLNSPRRASSTLPFRSVIDGLLVEVEVAQRVLGIGQALAVVVVGGGRRDQPRQADRRGRRRRGGSGWRWRSSEGGGSARPPASRGCADGAGAARGWSACRAAR